MTRKAFAIAAALIASTTVTTLAEAGGVRLGFGGPLPSFVARPTQSYGASSYGGSGCAKSQPRSVARAYPPAPKRPRVQVAEKPAPRAVKAKASTFENKVAKVEDKTTATDAVPSIYVPTSPDTKVASTQSTSPVTAPAELTTATVVDTGPVDTVQATTVETVAAVETGTAPAVVAAPLAKVEPATVKVEEPKKKVKVADVKKICRRFSPAIAGLIEVPCE